jgi:CheY-like chemotaxis protein
MIGILRAFGALFLNTTGSASANGSRSKAQAAPEKRVRGTMLAIDDDSALLDVLRPLLSAEGFNVLTACSGAKGLDMMRYCERDIRVVVLDYNMPRLNGAETLTFLRKLNPRVKILALTGVDANLLPESFRTGVDKILAKPYSTGQLIDNVNELLGFDPTTELGKS